MADDNLDVLLRTTDNTTMSLEQSKKFNNTKRKINGICKALSLRCYGRLFHVSQRANRE